MVSLLISIRPRIESGWSKAHIEGLGYSTKAELELILITLQPTGASGKNTHAVDKEQFVFVVFGEVTLTSDDAEQTLKMGDAVTIFPHKVIRWVNTSVNPLSCWSYPDVDHDILRVIENTTRAISQI